MERRRITLESQRTRISALRDSIQKSTVGLQELNMAVDFLAVVDSVSLQRTTPTTFSPTRAWGIENIPEAELLFASQREPVVRWLVWWMAVDIFDNWFKVVDPDNPDDESLNTAIQQVLTQLNAKQNLTRLTTFERRYGTAILLCGYAGFTNQNFETPIYETSNGLNNPMGFLGTPGDDELLQITPYPWTKVNVKDIDKDTSSLRAGLPNFYDISRGIQSSPTGTSTSEIADLGTTKAHWSKVLHAAPRLDENAYEGESVVAAVYDDATGFRNSRWAQYETIFRYGSGFPKFTFPWATARQIRRWIESGEITNINARGYFVAGQEGEDVEFIGVKGVTLNPLPYNEMALDALSMATRIPRDVLKGASAGTISGSDVNERAKFQTIRSEQSLVEPIVRELIDRIIDTGQVKFIDKRKKNPTKGYIIEWNFPQIVNERDRADIDFLTARAKTEDQNRLTIDEMRAREDPPLPPLPEGGDVVLGVLKTAQQPFEQSRPGGPERETTETDLEMIARRKRDRDGQ